ncbi:hypothetical protein AAVH_32831 [Aphelenchoides avenae]|nr:hypothetical protein AAVH_32831 [Aphelenchus avenae]
MKLITLVFSLLMASVVVGQAQAQYWRWHEVFPHTNSIDWGQRGANNAYPGYEKQNSGVQGVWAMCTTRNCGVGRK